MPITITELQRTEKVQYIFNKLKIQGLKIKTPELSNFAIRIEEVAYESSPNKNSYEKSIDKKLVAIALKLKKAPKNGNKILNEISSAQIAVAPKIQITIEPTKKWELPIQQRMVLSYKTLTIIESFNDDMTPELLKKAAIAIENKAYTESDCYDSYLRQMATAIHDIQKPKLNPSPAFFKTEEKKSYSDMNIDELKQCTEFLNDPDIKSLLSTDAYSGSLKPQV